MTGAQLYEKERDAGLENIIDAEAEFRGLKTYNCKTITAGDQVEVQLYELWPTGSSRKGKAEKLSRPAQERLNLRRRQEDLIRLINRNFTEKDTWLTLTYGPKFLPFNEDEAYRRIKNYIAAVKRKYGKRQEIKYVYTTEIGHRTGRIHHHIILNVHDRDGLEDLWASRSERARKRKNPNYRLQRYGRTQRRRLQPDDFGLTGMAKYVSKDGGLNKKKFVCSRNLTKPTVKKTKSLRGRKLTGRYIKRLATDGSYCQREILRLFPDCEFNDIQLKRTPYTKNFYIYIRLRRITI